MNMLTACKYLRLGKLPSEIQKPHAWRTRMDPFANVWEEGKTFLEVNPNLDVKVLFGKLQRRYGGKFQPDQLRTLELRVKHWRVTEGCVQSGQVSNGAVYVSPITIQPG